MSGCSIAGVEMQVVVENSWQEQGGGTGAGVERSTRKNTRNGVRKF